jgi:hypothetical protein
MIIEWILFLIPGCKSTYRRALMRTFGYELVEALWTEVQKLNLPLEQQKKYSSTIFVAARLGNVEFLTILINSDPNLIWMTDDDSLNIFQISIIYRQESIFKQIHEMGIFKNMISTMRDKERNNMLHLAGKSTFADRLKSGTALQMQRELLWFKVYMVILFQLSFF